MKWRESSKWVTLALALVVILAPVREVDSDAVSVTPSNTNGFELGELSPLQGILISVVMLKFLFLTLMGVLPIPIDLGGIWYDVSYLLKGMLGEKEEEDSYFQYVDDYGEFQGRSAQKMHESTFVLDCSLQFVCDVDAWANKDHEYFTERLIASWFRNPNSTWHHTDAQAFGGVGSCKEMYPCPFDVQEFMGISIPGSKDLISNSLDESF